MRIRGFKRRSVWLLVAVFTLLLPTLMLWAQAIPLPNSSEALSGTETVYEFAYGYPDGWQEVELEGSGGGVVALIGEGAAEPSALIALSVHAQPDARTAVESATSHTFPVGALGIVSEFPINNRDGALIQAVLTDERPALIAAVRLNDELFAVGQLVVTSANLDDLQPVLLAMVASVRVTTILGGASVESDPDSQRCNYEITVTFSGLRARNSEEAGTAADVDFDGDQIIFRYGIGPIIADNQVDSGRLFEFTGEWRGDVQVDQRVDNLGVLTRYACTPDFGLQIELLEDDSTPFGEIETRMGGRRVLPLVQNGTAVELQLDGDGEVRYDIAGETQDGNFEYRLLYRVEFQPVDIPLSALTPTLTPSITPTFTPSETLTPTETFTPSNTPTATLTPTPTATFTPSNTPTNTLTPTPSFTPTNTATFTPSPTLDLTQAFNDFNATQTSFAITLTSVVATLTPSETPTLNADQQFLATQTAFAATQAAFLTLSAPTATPTATLTLTATFTATFTPTDTPTATLTPTNTLTPSETPTPTNTATFTPSPTSVLCEGSLPSRLYAGIRGRVTPGGDSNNLRPRPNTSTELLAQIQPGDEFDVVGGPECAQGFLWWEVEYFGITGWTVESDDEDYWLEPIIVLPTGVDATCEVRAREAVNMRVSPGRGQDLEDILQPGQIITAIARNDGRNNPWLLLNNGFWVREDAVTALTVCSIIPQVDEEGIRLDTGEPMEIPPTPTPAPTEVVESCAVSPIGSSNINRRAAPNPNGNVVGVLEANTTADAIGQYTVDGVRWWRLDDDSWVRDDTVSEEDTCDLLPETPPS